VTAASPNVVGQVTPSPPRHKAATSFYTWNFGDGSPVTSGSSSTVTHTYPAIGTYTAIVTATNSWNSQQVSIPVRIRDSVYYLYLPLVQNAYAASSALGVTQLPTAAPANKGRDRSQ
jgi:PKD repeat protein